MSEFKEKLKAWWNWFKSLFITYYKLDVSYNHTWGDADDQTFVVKKFHKKQEKFLSFTTQDGELVEIRGAEGLNYRITEL
jgi:hypothetical protein